MKKAGYFLAYLLALLMLAVLWYYGGYRFYFLPEVLIIYGTCFLLCPFLGRCCLPKFIRVLFAVLSVLTFAGGILAIKQLAGFGGAMVLLTVGTVCMGTLLIHYALPESTVSGTHLLLRGLYAKHAGRYTLRRQSFAFFFLQSGLIITVLLAWSLLNRSLATPDAWWSAALLTAVFGFLGYILYLVLGAPSEERAFPTKSKGKYICISLLVFLLLLIVVYIYTGYIYIKPDASMVAAIRAVQPILFSAFFGTLGGWLLGLFLGWLLHFGIQKVMFVPLRSLVIFPSFAVSAFLQYWLPFDLPYRSCIAIGIPICLFSAYTMLGGYAYIAPYRRYMPGRTIKTLFPAFLLKANLAQIFPLLAGGLFTSVYFAVAMENIGGSLSYSDAVLAACIVSIVACIIYVLCVITREARQYE